MACPELASGAFAAKGAIGAKQVTEIDYFLIRLWRINTLCWRGFSVVADGWFNHIGIGYAL